MSTGGCSDLTLWCEHSSVLNHFDLRNEKAHCDYCGCPCSAPREECGVFNSFTSDCGLRVALSLCSLFHLTNMLVTIQSMVSAGGEGMFQ